ncbi:MAG TPA: DMT family transporter [Feifaniaceae bacterium]|nr:DMT family transporter [Feifaniaceae bacterium]
MAGVLSILSGILISVMMLFNGQLSEAYGNAFATVLIHAVGLLCIGAWLMIKKQGLKHTLSEPRHLYLGGVIGIATVMLTNLTFSHLGVSLTLVLSLLGQVTVSLVIDSAGLLGAKKVRFEKKKLIGVGLVAAGAAMMLLF